MSDEEEQGKLYIPEQIQDLSEEEEDDHFKQESPTIRLKMLRQDQDEILRQYEEEFTEFEEAMVELQKLRSHKQHQIKVAMEGIDNLKKDLRTYNTRKANLKLEVERIGLRDMGRLWQITVLALYVFMLYFVYKKLFFVVALNTYGLMINWRSLFVRKNDGALIVGIGIIILTWVLGINAM